MGEAKRRRNLAAVPPASQPIPVETIKSWYTRQLELANEQLRWQAAVNQLNGEILETFGRLGLNKDDWAVDLRSGTMSKKEVLPSVT